MKKILSLLIMAAVMITAISAINIKGDAVLAQGNVYNDGIVPLTDKNINWSGRWVDITDGKQASFESYVEIKFTGTSLQVNIDKSWTYVQVDGGEVKSKSFTKNTLSNVAKNLAEGTHTVKIFAIAQAHRPIIKGFKIDAGAKTLPVSNVKNIEFIGDSITEGYCTSADNVDTGIVNNNSVLHSYAYKTGQQLNKNYNFGFNIVAFGGIAVGKGSTTKDNDWLSMPERYFKEREHIKATDTSKAISLSIKNWDTTKYKPDYIVINLGTNDSRTDTETFKTAYVNFINKLRNTYSGVTIFVMTPFNTTKANEIRQVVSTINNSKVILIDSSLWNIPAGSDDLHPAPAAHDTASEKLYQVLDNYLKNGTVPQTNAPTNKPTTKPSATPKATNGTIQNTTATAGATATGEPQNTQTPDTPVINTATATATSNLGENLTNTPLPTQEAKQEENKMHWGVFVPMGAAVLIAATTVTTVIIKKKKQ